jgi:hypothetical protein
VWANYCKEEGITPQRVKQEKDPSSLITDFVPYMQEVNTPDSHRTEAMPAVKELLHMLGATEGLNQNDFVKGVIRNTTRSFNHQSKYREIWDLGILLDHIRQGPPAEKLTWGAQSTITIALLMILVPLRPIAIFRINPPTERPSVEAGSIEVATREKTDSKASETWAVIRPGKDPRLCPLRHSRLTKQGAGQRGLRHTLWCTDAGKPFKGTGLLLQRLTKLITAARIPPAYGAYSIRHATITALMNARNKDDKEVAAFTGHSTKSETIRKFYYHLDKNQASQVLAALTATGATTVAVSEQVAEAILNDEQEQQDDEEQQENED